MRITFKRYNDQDVECAEDNYPDDPPQTQLEKQFQAELDEAIQGQLFTIHVDGFLHPEENVMVVYGTVKLLPKCTGVLVRDIQRILYDEGGMTGFFDTAEETYPLWQNL